MDTDLPKTHSTCPSMSSRTRSWSTDVSRRRSPARMKVKTFHKIIDRSSLTSYGKSDHMINNYYRRKINYCLRSVSVSRGIVGDANDKEDEDQIKRQGFVLLVISVRVGHCTLSMKVKAERKMKNEDVDSVDESKVGQVDVEDFFINTVSVIRAVSSYVKLLCHRNQNRQLRCKSDHVCTWIDISCRSTVGDWWG